jgi:DNA-binding response OmpR family regulator
MSDTGRLDGRHILIVDDDPDIRETVNAVMQSEGATTTTVADGNAAVKACADDPPDLVVLDMMLPQRSGFLVLEKIKGYEDSPLVIMITANEGRRHRNYATELGADAYLQKPVPMEVLVDTAARLINERDAEEADLYEDDEDDSEE